MAKATNTPSKKEEAKEETKPVETTEVPTTETPQIPIPVDIPVITEEQPPLEITPEEITEQPASASTEENKEAAQETPAISPIDQLIADVDTIFNDPASIGDIQEESRELLKMLHHVKHQYEALVTKYSNL